MNKFILFFTILSAPFYTNAQFVDMLEEEHKQNLFMQYGQIYSYIESKISTDETQYTQPESGYELSVILERVLSRFLSLQSGLQFQSLNYKLGYERKSLYHINLEKLIVPLIFTCNSDLCENVNFSIFTGPQVGVVVNSSMQSLSVINNTRDTTNMALAINKVDFGFMYGASVGFTHDKLKGVKLIIGGRGAYGLSNISREVDIDSNQVNIIPNNSTIKTFGGFVGLKFII